jgi:hypothetical protein
MFESEREEVAGDWRRLHNEELCDLYASPTVISGIKSRMRWAGHVERVGAMRNAYDTLVGNREGVNYSET